MGYETVTYRCGHEDRVQMYGAHKDRDRRVADKAREFCPECQSKRISIKTWLAAHEGMVARTRTTTSPRSGDASGIVCYSTSSDALPDRGDREIYGIVTDGVWRWDGIGTPIDCMGYRYTSFELEVCDDLMPII